MRLGDTLRNYLALTKPSIMLLVVITGASGLVLEGSMINQPLNIFLVLFGLFCTGGSANALNQYFERDIDAQMSRTRKRRPLPQGRITPAHALTFSVTIGIIGCAVLWLSFNWLSASLALGTILFYGLFYTLYLKPTTAQNIVIGGAAGAMAPVIAWAAAANNLALAPWLLFLIIFLWTPPHFWALALYLQEDYKLVKLPMMPVVAGEKSTMRQMLWYSIALVAVTLSLGVVDKGSGLLYLLAAGALGAVFLYKVWSMMRQPSRQAQRSLFTYSIVYLLALFAVVIAEGMVGLTDLGGLPRF